jgi:protein SCO1/2
MTRSETRRDSVAAALLLAAAAALALACPSSTEVHSVRGEVVRVADGGRALEVDHEAVPGVMEAMQMTIPLLEPEQAPELAPGDKIRFDLYLSRGTGRIGKIEKLSGETQLELSGAAAHH